MLFLSASVCGWCPPRGGHLSLQQITFPPSRFMEDYFESCGFSAKLCALYIPSACAPLSGSHSPNLGPEPASFPDHPHLCLPRLAYSCVLSDFFCFSICLLLPSYSSLPFHFCLPPSYKVVLLFLHVLSVTRPHVHPSAVSSHGSSAFHSSPH